MTSASQLKLPSNIALDTVKTIAHRAGQIALDIKNSGDLQTREKSLQDRVTQADLAAEKYIKESLNSLNPQIAFMGEESGIDVTTKSQKTDYMWIVDPIDGTENYCRGIDHWSVSIALTHKGRSILGVVYVPSLKIFYSAEAHKGAWKNGQKLEISKVTSPTQALIAIGASGRIDFQVDYLQVLQHLNQQGIEHRRFGSAAYSLCQVAEGAVEGYVEKHLNPWDAAAGILIAEEAGAYIAPIDLSDPKGAPVYVVVPALKNCLGIR